MLLHQKDASDAMWKLYGIDSSAYLGTGYSVPLVGEGAKNYEFATQREYFVPNLCAEAADPVACPKKDANIWTWRLTSAELTQWADKLHHQTPARHGARGGCAKLPEESERRAEAQPPANADPLRQPAPRPPTKARSAAPMHRASSSPTTNRRAAKPCAPR